MVNKLHIHYLWAKSNFLVCLCKPLIELYKIQSESDSANTIGRCHVVYKGNMVMSNFLILESSPKLGQGHDLVGMAMITGWRNHFVI